MAFTVACLSTLNFCQAGKPESSEKGGGPAYTIVPFMPPGLDSIESGVSDLNEAGQAVGWVVDLDEIPRGLHLDIASGDYTLLPGGPNSPAGGVNNLNQIVGSNGDFGAFWAAPSADPVLLPPLPGDVRGWAVKINDAGMVIGASGEDLNPPAVPVIWRVTPGGVDGPLPLPPLPGGGETWGAAITEVVDGGALVVGYSFDGSDQAVVWTIELNADGTLALPQPPVRLGTLGLRNPSSSAASGVNGFGDISGTSDRRPFIAPGGGGPLELPVPRDTLDADALDINDDGDCVGYVEIQFRGSNVPVGPLYAFLWRSGEAIDLARQIPKQSGWEYLTWADSINNAGLIAGFGRFDVARRGFILIPN